MKEIKAILDSPDFDPSEAIAQQIALLELQYHHIGELISFARTLQSKGVKTMNFDVFNKNEIEQYKAEAKAKWGHTKAYKEYAQKASAQEERNEGKLAQELMCIFSEIGALRRMSPAEDAVQEKISVLMSFIDEHYYVCTKEILYGLGEMYVCDERFLKQIDRAGGDGTAAFVRQAISIYCAKSNTP